MTTDLGSTDPESAWAHDVEQLLGVPHNDPHFWHEYQMNAYFHAAVTVIRQLRSGGVRLRPDPLPRSPASRPTPDPVGAVEIAARLGVARATVDQWRQRGQFPQPRWTVGGRPAWDWPDIAAWQATRSASRRIVRCHVCGAAIDTDACDHCGAAPRG